MDLRNARFGPFRRFARDYSVKLRRFGLTAADRFNLKSLTETMELQACSIVIERESLYQLQVLAPNSPVQSLLQKQIEVHEKTIECAESCYLRAVHDGL